MQEQAVNFESLVDDIYEASVVPQTWHRVLDRMAEIADAEGTLLFAAAPGVPKWLASPAIHDRIDFWAKSRWGQKNSRGDRLVPIDEPRFLTDLDAFTIEELERDEYYTDLLRPMGLGWCVGTSIRSPAGDTLVFSVEKAWDKGPVPRAVAEQLDALRPHLARAGVLSARLGLERARASVAALEMIGLPAAAVTQAGRVVAANPGFLASSPRVGVGARDQVVFDSPAAQAMLIEALAKPASLAGTGRSIPVAGTASEAPLVAHVLPLRGAALEVFAGAMSILFITPLVAQSSPAPELLQALFDLTPAEARVASMLVDGQSVDAIARAQKLSSNTIRTQLKSVFAKTGVDRQVDLVSLLGQRRHAPFI
jgi:DNA-binding CsgD family transcriptional regulator